ncbi:MAG: hypothetical protein IJC82_04010 [Firmicutes bacterium]|nr:hypothetical protein [Bacillota bacterium]
MANEQNLIPRENGFTQEEAKKGGRKSGEVRTLRAEIRKQMNLKVPKDGMADVHELMDELGFAKKDRTYFTAMAAAAIHKAAKGDVKAMEFVRDTVGEKPTEKVEQEYGPKTRDTLEGMSLEQRMAALEQMKEAMFRSGGSE